MNVIYKQQNLRLLCEFQRTIINMSKLIFRTVILNFISFITTIKITRVKKRSIDMSSNDRKEKIHVKNFNIMSFDQRKS